MRALLTEHKAGTFYLTLHNSSFVIFRTNIPVNSYIALTFNYLILWIMGNVCEE
jgi:hypothetical protein